MTRPSSDDARTAVSTDAAVEADALARRIVGGAHPVRVGITGPGGSGKSTLLGDLAATLRAHGLHVVDDVEPTDLPDATERVAFLVDDAHGLTDDELGRLRELVRDDGPHVVVAFRPWPRSTAMAKLSDRLGRRGTVLALHPLTWPQVRRRGAELLGTEPAADAAIRVVELTHGNPRLVDAAFAAGADHDWAAAPVLPAAVLQSMRDELDGLEPGLHDYLAALTVGFSTAGPAFATAPRFAAADLRSLAAAARASGLVSPDGSLVPLVQAAILQGAPPHELWTMRRELVDAVDAAGAPLGDAALALARQGFRDPRVLAALRSRGDELLEADPDAAREQYAALIDLGAEQHPIAGRLAQAAWAVGDVAAAERLVDLGLGRDEPDDLARTVAVAAATWARKGMLDRSADACRTLAAVDGSIAPIAAICLAGVGDVAGARATRSDASDVEYPTSGQVALRLTADGILDALDGSSDLALSSLLQASSLMNESATLGPLPEAPAMLAAQVALNAGELDLAADVLQGAIDATQGGPAFDARLRLMQAFVALRADRPVRAREHLESAISASQPLGLRDEVLAHAVRIGLARRTDDLAALLRGWAAAREAIARMPIDLFALPALAELSVAAARLHETRLLEAQLAAAGDLLDRAGRPACWSAGLHWAAIEAAILLNDPDAVERHATALTDAAPGGRTAEHLARAGRTWAAAIAGDVVVERVEQAARDLAAAGYPWDASRLAGHAAGRASEHRDTLQLLALARSLHPDEERPEAGAEPDSEANGAQRDDGLLSAREREVARLVLEGKTYAEIGNAIFISPRTAEHHIARIRRRLGVTTRSELLARLRVALEEDPGQ
ncbi:LuxR C-terminal-related transcriptional regulator [Agromyces sp. NPDC004153]